MEKAFPFKIIYKQEKGPAYVSISFVLNPLRRMPPKAPFSPTFPHVGFALFFTNPEMDKVPSIPAQSLEPTFHDAAPDAFMTLPPYTRISEGEVYELGLGVRNCSHRALSDPLPEKSERIERACE